MVILIKKYENRRLYDTTNSRYVNLEDVAGLLQRGNEVRVVDAVSGEDITRLILTQIIVENAKTPNSHFPIDVLRQMVIASGRASQESALKYMKSMLEIYQDTYRAMTPLNPFDTASSSTSSTGKHSSARGTSNPTPNSDHPVESREGGANNGQAEVDSLKKRLSDLEDQVARLSEKKPPRRR